MVQYGTVVRDVTEAGRARWAAWSAMPGRLAMVQGPGAVDVRSFIVFFSGRDPGTLKSDIVSKKHPHLICSDLRLSN